MSEKNLFTFVLKLYKFQRPFVITTLLSLPLLYACTIPYRFQALNKKLLEELRGDADAKDSSNDSNDAEKSHSLWDVATFPKDETENSIVEEALEDLLSLQNRLFKLRSMRSVRSARGNSRDVDELKTVLQEMKRKVRALESLLYHENQYERMNRRKAFTVIRNALQCGSNQSLYIPKWVSKAEQYEISEVLRDIHFEALCILREMVKVPRYAETLVHKGMLAPVFDTLYKQAYDHRTRSLASDILFEWSKHPSTHASFLRWNDLITEMAKKGDPLCHYTVACMLGRIMSNKELKDSTRTYVDLIDSCWIIFKSAKDTFISSIAHKAFLVCSDNSTVDFSERENRIQVTDHLGMIFLTVAPILAYCVTRHSIRYMSLKYLPLRTREGSSTMSIYDVADYTIASTLYGLAFGSSLLYIKRYIYNERNHQSDSMLFGHKKSVWLTLSILTLFAVIGAYLYYRNYMAIVFMPFLYPISIHEVYPDSKKYVSRFRKPPQDYLRRKPKDALESL